MRSRGRFRLAAILLTVVAALPAAPARAQLSASLSIDSDYRYRGVSLSRHRPVARLDLDYDHPGGAYAGVSLIGMRDNAYGRLGLSYIGYAGYVWQPARGPSWEAGLTDTHIRNGADYDYNEIYGGLIIRDVTARLYYAPHYYGSRTRTLYGELSTARRLSPSLRVFLRAGMLTPLDGAYRRERYDARVGLALSLGRCEVQAAWSRTNPLEGYMWRRPDNGNALILSASAFF
jgi:uncharacterized protein (TIGR02001 family)